MPNTPPAPVTNIIVVVDTDPVPATGEILQAAVYEYISGTQGAYIGKIMSRSRTMHGSFGSGMRQYNPQAGDLFPDAAAAVLVAQDILEKLRTNTGV